MTKDFCAFLCTIPVTTELIGSNIINYVINFLAIIVVRLIIELISKHKQKKDADA